MRSTQRISPLYEINNCVGGLLPTDARFMCDFAVFACGPALCSTSRYRVRFRPVPPACTVTDDTAGGAYEEPGRRLVYAADREKRREDEIAMHERNIESVQLE